MKRLKIELPTEIMGKITYNFILPAKSVCVSVASRPFLSTNGKNGSLNASIIELIALS